MQLDNLIPNPAIKTFIIGKNHGGGNIIDHVKNSFPTKIVFELNQQHTNHCLVMTGDLDLTAKELTQPADAVLSDRTDIVLTLHTADCLPILLYHPSGIIGAVHAGRKGTELGVLTKTFESLNQQWGVHDSVTLWFGPAICSACYQIDHTTKTTYNLRSQNRQQAELFFHDKPFQIIVSEYCTFHDNTEWYSYRKDDETKLRNISVISLKARINNTTFCNT